MTTVLEDLLNPELTEKDIKIQVQEVFDFAKGALGPRKKPLPRTKSFGAAKTLREFYDLVRQSVNDMESRASVPDVNKVIFTEEDVDDKSDTETITFSLMKRRPGQFGQGPPFGAEHQNLRPVLREETSDPDNPGYRQAITGYWFDNLVRFTCWARTNKVANARAEWFENLMQEYSWWFKLQGVDRVLFWGRDSDIVDVVDSNKWYGRPIDYFVRTEKLRVFNEKTLEQILIELVVKDK